MMKDKNPKRKRRYAGVYWMVLPSYLIYFIFVFIPLVVTVYLSFTNYDLYKTHDFVGLSNYIRLVHDPDFLIAAKNTFVYAFFVIIPQIILGLIIAVVLNRKVLGQRFHRIVFYMPNVTSMVSISMIWLWMYDPTQGVLNQALKMVGLPGQRWLFNPKLALPSIIVMSIWKLIGYNMIIYLAGLQQVPEELYEAATIDGASAVQQFFRITVPMLKPTTFFLFVIACVQSFSVFDQVNVMTQGGPMNATTTIVHQIFEHAFSEFQMGYASSMATVLLIVCVTLTLSNFKYGNQGNDLGAS
ncbi:MAG TPA: sugar ABC transporter permease [Firmicutes bacterium]|jgi:ABC-type sugar transport system permease subunit|nr:sugar ABC transporter permease [Bacillota bacterium]